MKHLDLFSGIGGFALAARNVWGEKYENAGFVDNDGFCQKVLAKNFPNTKIYGDIKQFSGKGISADLITGGFPCQPFSYAGARRGSSDDRHLWPEMLRIIREIHPRWIVAENVSGLLSWNEGMVFEQILNELEGIGYEVQSFIIPALSVDAPHRRERLWIIAYSDRNGHRRYRSRQDNGEKKQTPSSEKRERFWSIPSGMGQKEYWIKTATELCRESNGIPPQLDRNKRRKSLGNAIVPQVAEEIFKAIRYEMET